MPKFPDLEPDIVSKRLNLSLPSSALPVGEVSNAHSSDSTDHGRQQRVGIETDGTQMSIRPRATVARERLKSVHDVAAYILQLQGEMTAMKLQKLVYYCQAWSLVWDEEPLFEEEIQAWVNGPVVPALYERHKGKFKVRSWNGNPSNLTDNQRDTIRKVLEFYGNKPSQVLSDLTHREAPWVDARSGLGSGERGDQEITHAAMAEYYGSL
jgi:uncharacterized phage-associated protein